MVHGVAWWCVVHGMVYWMVSEHSYVLEPAFQLSYLMSLLMRLLMRLLVCGFNTFCHHVLGFLCCMDDCLFSSIESFITLPSLFSSGFPSLLCLI